MRASMWWGLKRALLFEIICGMLIALIGFGGPFSFDPPWYHTVLPTTQFPAIFLLSVLGLCCGYSNGLLISDVVYDRWGGLTAIGAPVIFLVNVLVVGAILGFVRHRRTARQPVVASRPAPPAI